MNVTLAFFNPQTGLLRSGWRALIFIAMSPQMLLSLLSRAESPGSGTVLNVGFAIILVFVIYIGWTVSISWLCLRFLDRLSLSSLGFAFYRHWWRHILWGCAIGASMIIAIVVLQMAGGGTRVMPNTVWWRSGVPDYSGVVTVAGEVFFALILLILAGAFEELIYRGYPFQTLLRGLPAAAPIVISAILFGVAHMQNPNRTFFSTFNTALAGIWLSVAYLKTRSLWFPTALHFSWNWMMGSFLGLPVSGLQISRHSILLSTSENPIWLTGGNYGCEGGAAATLVLIVATILIGRAKGNLKFEI